MVAIQDRNDNISARDPDNIGAVQITPADFTRDNPTKANKRSINDEPSSNNSGRSDINTTGRREDSRENPATQRREDQTNTGDSGTGMGAAPVVPSTGQNNGLGSTSGSGNTAPGSGFTIPRTTTPNTTTPGIDTNPALTPPGTNPNPTAPGTTTPGTTTPGTTTPGTTTPGTTAPGLGGTTGGSNNGLGGTTGGSNNGLGGTTGGSGADTGSPSVGDTGTGTGTGGMSGTGSSGGTAGAAGGAGGGAGGGGGR